MTTWMVRKEAPEKHQNIKIDSIGLVGELELGRSRSLPDKLASESPWITLRTFCKICKYLFLL